jgi:tRNA 2-thiouridine synthesizing protein B
MLHTVNKSSFERNSLKSAVEMIDDASIVLLIEDGVISGTNGANADLIADLVSAGRVYALQGDVDARGISSKMIDGIKLVDYTGFVELVVEHGTPVSWL